MTQKIDPGITVKDNLLIDDELCDYCGTCVAVCPVDCIELKEKEIAIDMNICTLCMNCVHACPLHIIHNIGNQDELR